jgi:hypothetical protein
MHSRRAIMIWRRLRHSTFGEVIVQVGAEEMYILIGKILVDMIYPILTLAHI